MEKCIHCGASASIHRHDTLQCPVQGREAYPGKRPEWASTTYEPESEENNKTKLENFISLHGKEKASELFDEMLETLHRYAFSYDVNSEDEDNNDDVIDLLKNIGDWNDEI